MEVTAGGGGGERNQTGMGGLMNAREYSPGSAVIAS